MTTVFILIWLATLVAIIFGVIGCIKSKGKEMKAFIMASIIASFISFVGIGVTAPPVEDANNDDTMITEKNDKNQVEENYDVESSAEQVEIEEEAEQNAVIDFTEIKQQSLASIPAYANAPYVIINNNVPFFYDTDLTANSFENYSDLDSLGRCGVALASVGKDIMPTEERGNIGSIKPTGWHSVRYKGIDGNYLYNRCHLIGYQLTAENANEKNLITGTRYMNVEGMLPFENMVADYVKETGKHVLYRVTPIFEGNNLLASGVLMEAKSVEDNGDGIQFNVYCYNVQPGIEINYANGDSSGPEYTGTTSSTTNVVPPVVQENSNSENTVITNNTTSQTYTLNNNTKKFHEPSCRSAARIKDSNKGTFTGSRDELISRGYSPCGNCDP